MTLMKLFENKNLIRVIALALIAVLGFSAPAGDYVNSGGTTSRAATTAGDGVDTVADATTATGTAAAADGKQLPEDLNYVSEVRLFQSGEYEFALKDCKEAGYEPVEADLNKGTEKSGWGDIIVFLRAIPCREATEETTSDMRRWDRP
ncbi:MAG: hypothetical protein IJ526_06945 [Lachnospiraceae bacterium]|nr:hypothetical protein [Lachnospiraceae bacterium]